MENAQVKNKLKKTNSKHRIRKIYFVHRSLSEIVYHTTVKRYARSAYRNIFNILGMNMASPTNRAPPAETKTAAAMTSLIMRAYG